jgi:hypothetical protein
MSDGPHRSLPMRQGWRRLAECGDNHAFAPDEVSEAIVPALEQDCRAEMAESFLDGLWRIFCGREPTLFQVSISQELQVLRQVTGPGIGRVILDHAILVADRGKLGRDGLLEAVRNGLTDRAARGARQVEEHYYRESSTPRAQRVRARIEEAIAGAPVEGLARRILKIEDGPTARLTIRQGLDDGVRF